jgi:hypothetical protein
MGAPFLRNARSVSPDSAYFFAHFEIWLSLIFATVRVLSMSGLIFDAFHFSVNAIAEERAVSARQK